MGGGKMSYYAYLMLGAAVVGIIGLMISDKPNKGNQ
jgi:hypothetical protein